MKILSLDIETKDPYLKKHGSGAMRHDSQILCICAFDGETGYTNIAFEELEKLIEQVDVIIGANIQYDLSFLHFKHGLEIPKHVTISDILVNERLLDTLSPRVNLNSLALKYLGVSKATDELEAYAEQNKIKKYMENLDLIPIELVSKYCLMDSVYTHQIYSLQIKQLENFATGYEVENKIQRVLFEMKKAGIPFDMNKSRELEKRIDHELLNTLAKAIDEIGVTNVKTKDGKAKLAEWCKQRDIPFALTKTGKPQFNAMFFKKHMGGELAALKKLQELEKLRNDFIVNMRQMVVNGKIYPTFNPMKGDGGGAVTARFSCTKPNIQQIPSRNPVWGKLIRSQFKAPEGHVWLKLDYSQQEVRVMLHYAAETRASGAFDLIQRYQSDPKTDCYILAMDIAKQQGFDITRDIAKTLILANQYCMGPWELAMQLNTSPEEAKALLDSFKAALPFVTEFKYTILNKLRTHVDKGIAPHVTTLAGRHIHFNVVEEKIEVARGIFATVRQAEYAYKGINYTVQGSSADITKLAMINIWDKLGIAPVSTVHDELNFVLPDDDKLDSTINTIVECMENTYSLQVPMTVDWHVASNWGLIDETRSEILQEQSVQIPEEDTVPL